MTRRRRLLQNTAETLRQPGDLDNVAHFEPRRETVGDLLRRAREGKGHELKDVAGRLRIRIGYLKAIEDGRFHDLPGLTYAVGFVRTYADHLGLDAEDVVRRFRDEVTELKSQTQLIFPMVAAEGKIPRGAVLLMSAVLAAIAYGGWYYLSEREQSALDLIPALPEKLQALISGESADTPAVPDVSVTDSATAPEPAPEPAQAPAVDAAARESAPPALPEATPPSAEGQVAAVPPAEAPVAEAPAGAAPAAQPAPAVPAPGQSIDPAAESAASASARAGAVSAATEQAPAPEVPPLVDASPPAAPEAVAPDAAATGVTEPGIADPGLDSSGLPTVAAPSAPSPSTIPGISASSETASLPPVGDGQVYGVAEEGSRVVLVARLESWIQVTDPETNALLTRVLRAGDRYYVPDQGGLTLATGNAGGLDIWVDGRKAPALGPVGVVRRGIALDPQRLESGTALSE